MAAWALAEISGAKEFGKRDPGRRAIVVISTERQQASAMQPDAVFSELRRSRAALYAVTLPGVSVQSSAAAGIDDSAHAQVIGDGSKQSGGRRQEVTITAAIPKALADFSNELTHLVAVTYALPDGVKPDTKLAVILKRKGFSLRAPAGHYVWTLDPATQQLSR
ncbi:MAG: hypothetical protein ABI652_02140 [Acidobacteriota bacterium]